MLKQERFIGHSKGSGRPVCLKVEVRERKESSRQQDVRDGRSQPHAFPVDAPVQVEDIEPGKQVVKAEDQQERRGYGDEGVQHEGDSIIRSSMPPAATPALTLAEAASELVRLGAGFYQRGWMLGTSGNLSAVLSRSGEKPLRLAITGSSVDKGGLHAEQILEVNEEGASAGNAEIRPSAETKVHVEVVRSTGAGAVLHTHSVWSTVLSDRHWKQGGLWIEGYEMLKGLEGIQTHEHREWVPILDNTQDMCVLAAEAMKLLSANPGIHGFLVRRHGLYTWGASLEAAARHVEILEFLLEAEGRRQAMELVTEKEDG